MAIQLININKLSNSLYSVTVQDTGDLLGISETGEDMYQTYTARHNTALSAEDIKANIEEQIREKKKRLQEEQAVTDNVKTAVESIDTSKIATKE